MDQLAKIDQKFTNYTHAAIDALPISVTDSQKRLKVDDLNFVDDDIFIVETQKSGAFVFTQAGAEDEESKDVIAD